VKRPARPVLPWRRTVIDPVTGIPIPSRWSLRYRFERLRARRDLARHPQARRVYLRHLVRPFTHFELRDRMIHLPQQELIALGNTFIEPCDIDQASMPTNAFHLMFDEWLIRAGYLTVEWFEQRTASALLDDEGPACHAYFRDVTEWRRRRPADAPSVLDLSDGERDACAPSWFAVEAPDNDPL